MIETLRATVFEGDLPGGGSGRARVLAWSARRLVDLLRYRGRRPLHLHAPGAAGMTGQERALAAMFAALDAGDADGALAHAQWLVPTAEAGRLVRWARPVVECGGGTRRAA